jgi:hypothetical protein
MRTHGAAPGEGANGSTPADGFEAVPLTDPPRLGYCFRLTETIAQLVEHRIVVSAVAGSIPVSLPCLSGRNGRG